MKEFRENLTLLAVLTALCVAIAMMLPIPTPTGYLNLLDVGIYTVAFLMGPVSAAVVGAASGGMLDLLLGYPQWMVYSLVIHGLQGYLAGQGVKSKNRVARVVYLGLSVTVMVGGYYVAAAYLLSYGVGAVADIPGNVIQSIAGIIGAVVLSKPLKRTRYFR